MKECIRVFVKSIFARSMIIRSVFGTLLSILLVVSFTACGGSSDLLEEGSGDTGPSNTAEFSEKNGFVVMEAESSDITGDWIESTDIAGFTGQSYYEFNGNGICSGPAVDPLRFTFRVETAGVYELRLRCSKVSHCVAWKNPGAHSSDTTTSSCNHEEGTCNSLALPINASGNNSECPDPTTQCLRSDISNDAFVTVLNNLGNYVGFVNQPNNTLGDPIKLFGGQVGRWTWSSQKALDIANQKWDARWSLEPGEYTLVIEGRSKEFKLDRAVFFDVARGSVNDANDMDETK